MKELLWLIPVLPLVGALINGVVLRNRVSKKTSGWIAVGAVCLSCLLSVGAVAGYAASEEYGRQEAFEQELYSWIDTGGLHVASEAGIRGFEVPIGFMLDPLGGRPRVLSA